MLTEDSRSTNDDSSDDSDDLDNSDNSDALAIRNFREYVRIPSVHPNVNYDPCVTFLKSQAESLDLPYEVYYCFPKKPVVVLTWIGEEPTLPSILLNSHMDVVVAYIEKWIHPPFGAEMDDQKNIYGRGTQDMKSVSIQYLEAIRKLKRNGVLLKRTIHISFTPDEETGGTEGMAAFVKSNDYKLLNVGFALDEGACSSDDNFSVFYGERSAWKLRFRCPGQSGHSSLLFDYTPGEKVAYLLNQLHRFREEEKRKLDQDPSLKIGDVTTLNVTKLSGGLPSNQSVLPEELSFLVDCRLPLTVDFDEWETALKQWCVEAGEGVRIEYVQKAPKYPPTILDDSNPYWTAFQKAADKLKIQLVPQIFCGTTDSCYIRELGIPVLGFSPINNTTCLAHGHNEHLNREIFLKGIGIYTEIISAVASV